MEDPDRVKMAKLRNALTGNIQIRKQRFENLMGSFRASNASIQSTVQKDMIANRVKLGKLKECFRNLETDLFDALAVRAKQEAKLSATEQSISTANARIQLLEKQINDQRERRDEYASIISQQQLVLNALEEKSEDDLLEMKNINDLIMWYRRVLGLSIEGGAAGVKYAFSNINEKNMNDQYTFTVKLDGDTYSLVNCDPDVEDISTLMKDLNKTNDLFEFVRIMREKFKDAALKGIVPKSSSAAVMQASTSSLSQTSNENKSEKPMKENVPQVQSRKALLASQYSTPSPQSLSNRRRSPRIIDKQKH